MKPFVSRDEVLQHPEETSDLDVEPEFLSEFPPNGRRRVLAEERSAPGKRPPLCLRPGVALVDQDSALVHQHSSRAKAERGMVLNSSHHRSSASSWWCSGVLADVEELLAHGVDDGFHAGVEVQLLEDVAHVVLDRVLGDVQLVRDLAVAHALGHELEHLELA